MRTVRPNAHAVITIAAALLTGAFVVACSSGGGDNGNPIGPAPGAPCLSLAPEVGGPGTVSLASGASSTCSSLEIEVVVAGVNDLYTASFNLAFDPSVVTYKGSSAAGSVLGADGTTVSLQENPSTGSVVSLGVTRVGSTKGVDVSTSGRLVTLRFDASGGAGPSALTFSGGKLFGSETPPVQKPGISWAGGVVSLK